MRVVGVERDLVRPAQQAAACKAGLLQRIRKSGARAVCVRVTVRTLQGPGRIFGGRAAAMQRHVLLCMCPRHLAPACQVSDCGRTLRDLDCASCSKHRPACCRYVHMYVVQIYRRLYPEAAGACCRMWSLQDDLQQA